MVFSDNALAIIPEPLRSQYKANTTDRLDDVQALIRAMWAPLVLPVTAPSFTTLDGTEKKLPPAAELIHTEPLGKRVCILDVDTRPLDGTGDIFSPEPLLYHSIEPRSAGFLSHYLFAAIHGYTYRFVHAPQYVDRAPHWSKVIFTQELLKTFDVVVMLDYDAMFPSPEVPLEWLLNYWRVGRDVLVAMAEDPDAEHNLDAHRRVNLNSGFIIAQASDNAQKLFADWAECPEEKRYKGCSRWKNQMFHEQAAFSSHVRYDFLDGLSVNGTGSKYIHVLPCLEANGIPEVGDVGCAGQLVRHYWREKQLTTRELTNSVMGMMTTLLAKSAYTDQEVVMDFQDKYLVGDKILDAAPAEKMQAEEVVGE